MNKKKKRLTVLALSAKDALRLMTLMIITYLSTPAQWLPLQLTSILQLHWCKSHCPPLAWLKKKKKYTSIALKLSIPLKCILKSFQGWFLLLIRSKKILKLEFRLQNIDLLKPWFTRVFFHVSHKISSYFNMSGTWQIFEK